MTDADRNGKMRIENCRIDKNLQTIVYNNILDTSVLLKDVFFGLWFCCIEIPIINNSLISIIGEKTRILSSWGNFSFLKKKQRKKLKKTRQNKPKKGELREKIGVRCFAYFALAS